MQACHHPHVLPTRRQTRTPTPSLTRKPLQISPCVGGRLRVRVRTGAAVTHQSRDVYQSSQRQPHTPQDGSHNTLDELAYVIPHQLGPPVSCARQHVFKQCCAQCASILRVRVCVWAHRRRDTYCRYPSRSTQLATTAAECARPFGSARGSSPPSRPRRFAHFWQWRRPGS